jgi:hypothetical protein
LTQSGERVDALPAIDRLDRHQDAHLRGDLNHADSHKLRLNPARSGGVTPFHWTRILPRGPSNSMTHSDRPDPGGAIGGATNSKNSAGDATLRLTGAADSAKRFNLAYSRRKILAVKKTPCSRAAAAADAHNAAGIGKRF